MDVQSQDLWLWKDEMPYWQMSRFDKIRGVALNLLHLDGNCSMLIDSQEFKSVLIRLVFIANDGCSEGYVIRKAEEAGLLCVLIQLKQFQ